MTASKHNPSEPQQLTASAIMKLSKRLGRHKVDIEGRRYAPRVPGRSYRMSHQDALAKLLARADRA